jgi:hypothetical protein
MYSQVAEITEGVTYHQMKHSRPVQNLSIKYALHHRKQMVSTQAWRLSCAGNISSIGSILQFNIFIDRLAYLSSQGHVSIRNS